ncbi:MAG: lipopolysaccharide heptosyltransferase I [Helicobacter sp.]|nr:lipopolysaccharide heptosyltransferase I [Helicobacter sp.]
MKITKIAIIRLGALGDIIICASFLAHFKRSFEAKFGACEIHFFADSIFADILNEFDFIKLHKIPLKAALKNRKLTDLAHIYKNIRKNYFDIAIDFQGLIKSSIFTRMLRAKKRIGFDARSARESLSAIFYTQKISIDYNCHILKRNAALYLSALNEPDNISDFIAQSLAHKSFEPTQKNVEKIAQKLAHLKSKKVLFLIEASKEIKAYSEANFIELGLALESHANIIILAHKNIKKAKTIAEHLQNPLILSELDLLEVIALVNLSDLVIGGDTGICHLAFFTHSASVTLYSNTNPKRLELISPKNAHLSAFEGSKNINDITPKDIYNLALKLLK